MPPQPVAASPDPASDLELLQRIRAGDARATEQLVRRHNRTLYRTARAILRDDAEAEDAVQDAYLRAFRSLDAFRGEAAVSTWLVRIAANEALMRLRRDRREERVISFGNPAGELPMEEFPDRDSRGPEAAAANEELRRFLETGIDALPDLYRPVFMLRAVEEMTVEETAAALGIPEATVRTRFFRARAMMRGSLEARVDRALGDAFAFAGERCDRIVKGVLEKWGQVEKLT